MSFIVFKQTKQKQQKQRTNESKAIVLSFRGRPLDKLGVTIWFLLDVLPNPMVGIFRRSVLFLSSPMSDDGATHLGD